MSTLLLRIKREPYAYLIGALIVFCVLATIIPFKPKLPIATLDGSWAFGLNAAVAQGLLFGKDIVFSFGPYASLYTREYHPATDHLMMWGSLFFGVGYLLLLYLLSRGIKPTWLFIYVGFLVFYWYMSDAWFFSYSFLLCLLTYRLTLSTQHTYKLKISKYFWVLYAALFSVLGLLSLVKGTFLAVSLCTIFLCSLFLGYKKQKSLAGWAILMPILSMMLFWVLAGQPLSNLPHFLSNSVPAILGHTEAMSIPGKPIEFVFYLISCGLIGYAILRANNVSAYSKIFLLLSFALFLFIASKSSFIRHDGHATIAGTAIIIAALSLNFILTTQKKLLTVLLFFSVLSFWYIDKTHKETSTKTIHRVLVDLPKNTIKGLKYRLLKPEALVASFDECLNEIHAQHPLLTLEGTTDIYSYQQSALLASKNTWSPRPVFQSYFAYMPQLEELNRQHLLGPNAPDNIIFAVETIDNRYPSLDDGLSWPTLMSHYFVSNSQKDHLYLKKRNTPRKYTETVVYEGVHELDEKVSIPHSPSLLFAKIDVTPTFMSEMLSIGFKPAPLKITVTLQDGTRKTFRFISNMGRAGFLLSPLIETNKEFVMLATGSKGLYNKKIKNITISAEYGKGILWAPEYSIKLTRIEFNASTRD